MAILTMQEPKQDHGALDSEACWRAVVERDGAQDGEFYFGVVTTGVFCRPSCGARRPLRRNVRFFQTPDEAEASGLRACLRCRPKQHGHDVETIRALCEFIREEAPSGEKLTLKVLAEKSGLEAGRLRSLFTKIVGMSPRRFVDSIRFENLRGELRGGAPVTDAIYEAGFASPSRVYEQSAERLGMTPSTYRSGGKGAAISFTVTDFQVADTDFGLLLLAATDHGLCFVALGDDASSLESELRTEFPQAEIQQVASGASPLLSSWLEALHRHLKGDLPHLDLPLDVRATAFQAKVWNYLQSIPFGETRTYKDIAEALGKPKASRAVGTACGSNPVALAIPCHRVLRTSGHLAGFRWGLGRKQALLDREKPTGVTKN